MDKQKISWGIGISVIAWLLLATPVAAQDIPPNDELHINSAGVRSGELPAPLPSMPRTVIMPEVVFPVIDSSTWPVLFDGEASMMSNVETRLTDLQGALHEQYDSANRSIGVVRSTTNMVRDFVGNPQTTVGANTGSRTVTVSQMAQEMSASVSTSLSWVRAVAAIGPVGLDLIFIFIGLAWVIFVHFAELIIKVIAWFIRLLGNALDFIWKLLLLLATIAKVIVGIVDLFWPF